MSASEVLEILEQPPLSYITVSEALPEAEEQGVVKLLDNVLESGKPYVGTETRFEFVDKTGAKKKLYLNFVYEPIRNAILGIEGVLVAITDVTEQVIQREQLAKVARASSIERRKLDLMINEAPIGESGMKWLVKSGSTKTSVRLL